MVQRNVVTLGILLSFVFGGILLAQSSNASLTGRITDSSKAVVPGVKVFVINTGTRIHYETITNETGSYYVTDLPPGTYRIEVEKLGFKAVIKADLILHVQDALEVNFEMVPGSSSESVTVQGGAPLLDTESSTIGTVVEQRKANELPLNGRNVFNLIELAASVVPQGSSTGTPVGVNPFGWGNYQVNGSFGNESAEYLDGQPLNIGYINLPVLIPTQDSVQEFKVQTSNLGPEWGKFAGGVTNLSTKAGTSSVHGEVYEYLRNKIFNANVEAFTELQRANDLKADMPETLYSLGKAASLVGDTAVAEKAWLRVIDLEKNTALAAQSHFGLAALYRKEGKTARAQQEMQEFQKLQSTIGPPRSE
jgi:Carboxypeptidase regulatory-like domain